MATVTIDAQRWERVAYAARMAAHYQLAALNPGDGDDVERDVAPVAPDPGLREVIAKAIWGADRGYVTSIPWPPASEFRKGQAERIADAVLAVLAERGMA